MSIPADVASRLAAMFARMQARGLTEPVDVYEYQAVTDATGRAVARERVWLTTLQCYIMTGGGTEQEAQEGPRSSETLWIFFVPDPSLSIDTSAFRWVIPTARSQSFYRITTYQQYGPYAYAIIESGGIADPTGGTKA